MREAPVLSVWCFWESGMTREQISDFCIVSLAKVLRIPKDRVETGTKFNRLGLDSAMVVYVMMDLEERLGLELSLDDFYDYPTVNDLSRYLAERHASVLPLSLATVRHRYRNGDVFFAGDVARKARGNAAR